MKQRNGNGAGIAFAAWFLFCVLIGLGTLGVIIWAIIKLVVHFTGGSQ